MKKRFKSEEQERHGKKGMVQVGSLIMQGRVAVQLAERLAIQHQDTDSAMMIFCLPEDSHHDNDTKIMLRSSL